VFRDLVFPMQVDEIVTAYILNFRQSASDEMRYFAIQRSLTTAIHKAARCLLPSGKRHPHQRRIPKALLEQAERHLQATAKDLERATDFTDLYHIVELEIGSIPGIGPLTVYDISHRLGAFLRKAPDLVYLHAGTKRGAAVLGLSGAAIHPGQLPAVFSRLTAAEIEDCLCIYKEHLRKSSAPNPDGTIPVTSVTIRCRGARAAKRCTDTKI
jgi:hypothetical protein